MKKLFFSLNLLLPSHPKNHLTLDWAIKSNNLRICCSFMGNPVPVGFLCVPPFLPGLTYRTLDTNHFAALHGSGIQPG